MTSIVVTVSGWNEIQEVLAQFSQNAGERFVAPGLNAAARVVARKAKTRNFGFRDGPNRRGPSGRRLRSTVRSGLFRSGSLKGRAARVLVGGRGAAHATPLQFGQSGTPKAPPYRGGPQVAAPRPFILEAQLGTTAAQEAAFAANLRKRFPTLLRRLQARQGRAATLGATFGRRVSLRGRRRR